MYITRRLIVISLRPLSLLTIIPTKRSSIIDNGHYRVSGHYRDITAIIWTNKRALNRYGSTISTYSIPDTMHIPYHTLSISYMALWNHRVPFLPQIFL